MGIKNINWFIDIVVYDIEDYVIYEECEVVFIKVFEEDYDENIFVFEI